MSVPGIHTDRFERLRKLTEVSRALTYATSIREVLHLAVERAAELMGAERALIMLGDQEGLLTVRAAHGVDEERVRRFREPLNESLVQRLQGLLEYPTEECFVSVPLVAQGQVTGLLAAVRPPGTPCTDDDEWLLSALADQAAVALENARLADAVRDERDQRQRMVEAQGRAHATLGHELRSPLTAIQSYSALLLEGTFGPLAHRQRESIARIQLSGRHLLSIIDNVLDTARINARTLSVAVGRVSLAQVLTEAVQMLQPLALEKGQRLSVEDGGSYTVSADPDRLRQVLLNLLGNAINYTAAGGSVRVSVTRAERPEGSVAAIAIADTGRGIAPEVLPTIFEPYVRGRSSGYEPGLGLGLFISRELVRKMNGDIEVRSEPGAGSTFTIYIPLAAESAA